MALQVETLEKSGDLGVFFFGGDLGEQTSDELQMFGSQMLMEYV